jgi:hypothetical protein
MKRIYLSIMVLACGLGAVAQQEFYVFIQDLSHQPFYVRMGQESHSSSAEGHIILARLRDSVYNLYIGSPRSRGEELFTVTINKKDHGYELRNVNGRRQLFDLQTLQVINPVATTLSGGQTIRKTDSYSELMAGVVDDSAVLYTSPADTLTSDTALAAEKADPGAVARVVPGGTRGKKKKPAAVARDTVVAKKDTPVAVADTTLVKIDTAAAVVKTDTAAKIDSTKAATVAAAQPDSSVRDKRDIIRLSTENIVEGKLMIYVDRTGPVNDTIRIIIPRRL